MQHPHVASRLSGFWRGLGKATCVVGAFVLVVGGTLLSPPVEVGGYRYEFALDAPPADAVPVVSDTGQPVVIWETPSARNGRPRNRLYRPRSS